MRGAAKERVAVAESKSAAVEKYMIEEALRYIVFGLESVERV